jgi:hypothetical protein
MSKRAAEIYSDATHLAEGWYAEGGCTRLVTFLVAAQLLVSKCARYVDENGLDPRKFSERCREVLANADGFTRTYIAAAGCGTVSPTDGVNAGIQLLGYATGMSDRNAPRALLYLTLATELASRYGGLTEAQREVALKAMPEVLSAASEIVERFYGPPTVMFMSRGGDA